MTSRSSAPRSSSSSKPSSRKPAAATKKTAPPPPELEDIKRELCERSLYRFAREAWHVLEPGRPFVEGKHLKVICQRLEAVSAGYIRKLVINVPPRHTKTLIVSVIWPAWNWLRDPTKRYLCASYDLGLSLEHAMKMRRLIESPWFQERWSERFKMTGDQDAKKYFENDKTGYRISTSVDAGTTGKGADVVIVDDPHNVRQAESDAKRAAVIEWWTQAISTRGNDPKTVAYVIVMQRVHEEDLAGYVLDNEEDWQLLCFPARFDGERREDALGPYDWRTEEGELLWPERFGPREVDELARNLGPWGEAAQLQQRPVAKGGGLFQRAWFEVGDVAPAVLEVVRFWDRAATENDGDWTVGLLLGRTPEGVWYVLDVIRFQGGPEQVEATIKQTAALDGPEVPVDLELQPGSAGKTEEASYYKAMPGFVLRFHSPSGSKVVRAAPIAGQAKAGNVKVLRRDWTPGFLAEVEKFPRAKFDDQVDAFSGAYAAMLKFGGGRKVTGPVRTADRKADGYAWGATPREGRRSDRDKPRGGDGYRW
jgi:predicted phage terminase large subunit-like protein